MVRSAISQRNNGMAQLGNSMVVGNGRQRPWVKKSVVAKKLSVAWSANAYHWSYSEDDHKFD
jgi:hypothetical protein